MIVSFQATCPVDYSLALVKCQRELIHNPDLTTFFVRAAFGTTPANDRENINRIMDFTDTWFRTLGTSVSERDEDVYTQFLSEHNPSSLETPTQNRFFYRISASTPLPESFCYTFFNTTLSVLFQSEHYQILLKALTFL
jgi:hypothetical protein